MPDSMIVVATRILNRPSVKSTISPVPGGPSGHARSRFTCTSEASHGTVRSHCTRLWTKKPDLRDPIPAELRRGRLHPSLDIHKCTLSRSTGGVVIVLRSRIPLSSSVAFEESSRGHREDVYMGSNSFSRSLCFTLGDVFIEDEQARSLNSTS